jgi:hypothetical protein
MKLTKEAVAIRQMNTAIKMLFGGGDVVSIHTLASAATNVFSDMLRKSGRMTWKQQIKATFPGQERVVHDTLHEAQNFFKHAADDPKATLEFDPEWNDHMIIVGTLEYGELVNLRRDKTTMAMSVFHLWYFAKAPELMGNQAKGFMKRAHQLFPELKKYPRFHQLALGASVLRAAESTMEKI